MKQKKTRTSGQFEPDPHVPRFVKLVDNPPGTRRVLFRNPVTGKTERMTLDDMEDRLQDPEFNSMQLALRHELAAL